MNQEGIEFAVRNSMPRNNSWVPLRITYYDSRTVGRPVGIETIRGYDVQSSMSSVTMVTERVSICGNVLDFTKDVEVRWMGTSHSGLDGIGTIVDVTATLFNPPRSEFFLMVCYIQDQVSGL